MELEATILEQVRYWDGLSRWERAELGRALRRSGLSYGEIMDLIPVKKSTLATWCREIRLTDSQIASIKERRAQIPGLPRDTQRARSLQIVEIRRKARAAATSLIADPRWVAGVVLYWAEGGKSRNDFKVANADPRALKLFIRWVRTYINPEAEFSLHLHLHEGNNDDAAKAHWREVLDLPHANFYRTFVKPRGTGQRKNLLEQGICSVKVRRCADAWQTTMEWVDVVANTVGA